MAALLSCTDMRIEEVLGLRWEDIDTEDIPKLLDRRYVALLLYCPARSEDIRGIRMKDIDPHKMLIRIERSVT